jgi:hypothetical protein
MMIINSEPTKAYYCLACEGLFEDTYPSPLYECIECGKVFNRENGYAESHLCPDCTNKPGKKIAEFSCEGCEEGPLEEVDAVQCEFCDGELVIREEFEKHLRDNHDEDIAEKHPKSEDENKDIVAVYMNAFNTQ